MLNNHNEPQRLSFKFTGSGSEYFRIWIVNLFLVVITFGIYYPWARVRKLRYFYANTLVDDDALGFHGTPQTMFKGYLLIAALGGVYSVLSNVSPIASVIALVALFAVGPALWRAGLRFRLANTSWRGLRFAFTGSVKDAYATQWPVLVPLFLFFGASALLGMSAGEPGKPQLNAGWVAVALLPLLCVVGTVYSFWAVKKYQHSHYALGEMQTRFSAGVGPFAKLYFKLFGMMVLIMLALGVVTAVFAPMMGNKLPKGFWMVIIGAALYLVVLAFILSIFKPWFVARTQNLVWNHTGNEELQFHSALKARSLIGLAFKNWLLIIVTLGFYWPFAAIATTRMRLEAVYADLTTSADLLTGSATGAAVGASGEAAGDLFGLDVGL
jgi:uncharacterized membrane protein YjgN (DUF898 family)